MIAMLLNFGYTKIPENRVVFSSRGALGLDGAKHEKVLEKRKASANWAPR